jgi:hypothetical protein
LERVPEILAKMKPAPEPEKAPETDKAAEKKTTDTPTP